MAISICLKQLISFLLHLIDNWPVRQLRALKLYKYRISLLPGTKEFTLLFLCKEKLSYATTFQVDLRNIETGKPLLILVSKTNLKKIAIFVISLYNMDDLAFWRGSCTQW